MEAPLVLGAAHGIMAKKKQSTSRARGKADAPDDQEMPFEEALQELEEIVAALEQGELTLQQSLDSYEKGIGRLKVCYLRLQQAERRIELLSGFDAEGNAILDTFADDGDGEDLMEKQKSRSQRRTAGKAKRSPIDESDGLF